MIRQFAGAITSFLLNEKIIEQEDYDVYRYGTEQILINLFMILGIVVTSGITGWWLESLFFFVGIVPIRTTSGGYHASTPYKCSLMTIMVYIGSLLVIDVLKNKMTLMIFIMMLAFIGLSVLEIGPVDNKNRRLTEGEYIFNRRGSNIAVFFIVMICILQLAVLGLQSNVLVSTLMGAVTATTSLIIGSIKRGGERDDETKLYS